VGVSARCADPEGLGRALLAAGLAVDFRPDGGAWALVDADLAPVRAHYESTVAPLVRYDDVYDTELVPTLERVLDANGDEDLVAADLGVPAHRVRYRLEKVRELSGWDPAAAADRRVLALGVRCWRVVAPGLPG
jgi:DNA-binding PucR family transcriptional regulator